jgi:hypothetical protein
MRRTPLAFCMAAWMVSPVLAADRLTDRDVKALVSRIEEGRDRFDDALGGNMKHGIVRGPSGEVKVDKFLDDFQENIDRLEERLKPDYAASNEAATLLRQATAIDRFFGQQPAGTRGESEWNRLATDLKTLAVAYGTTFPLAEGAVVRRMGDREVAEAADRLAQSSAQLKKSLDQDLKKDKSVPKGDRDAIVHDADRLSKDAKVLRDRIKDGKPSSAEAAHVMESAGRLGAFVREHQLPTASAAWTSMSTGVQTLATAYGLQVPSN